MGQSKKDAKSATYLVCLSDCRSDVRLGGRAVCAGAAELSALDERSNVDLVVDDAGLGRVTQLYELRATILVPPELQSTGSDAE